MVREITGFILFNIALSFLQWKGNDLLNTLISIKILVTPVKILEVENILDSKRTLTSITASFSFRIRKTRFLRCLIDSHSYLKVFLLYNNTMKT